MTKAPHCSYTCLNCFSPLFDTFSGNVRTEPGTGNQVLEEPGPEEPVPGTRPAGLDRPDWPDRLDRTDRPDMPDWPDRLDRPDQQNWPDRPVFNCFCHFAMSKSAKTIKNN